MAKKPSRPLAMVDTPDPQETTVSFSMKRHGGGFIVFKHTIADDGYTTEKLCEPEVFAIANAVLTRHLRLSLEIN